MHSSKPKEEILVDGEEGKTSNDREATEIITKFLKNFFNAENERSFNEVPPTPTRIAFTEEEIGKAVKALENNKSAGINSIVAEQLKYGPREINQGIAVWQGQVTIPKKLFTEEEIGKAVKALENNKSAGINSIVAEQLKYGPREINQGIAVWQGQVTIPKKLKKAFSSLFPSLERKKAPRKS